MAIVTTHLVSGRVPVVAPTSVTPDRYTYLGLSQAEPNLGYSGNGNVLTTNIYGQRIWSSNINLTNIQVTGTIVAGAVIAGGINQYVSNTVPATAAVGDQWYDTSTDILFQYENTGSSNVWVDVSSVALNTNVATILGTTLSITGNGTITSGLTVGSLTINGSETATGTLTINSSGNPTAILNGNVSGVGNIGSAGTTFNTVFAKATTAQYADLAEIYASDSLYPAGTVVIFGGVAEVTASTTNHDSAVAGVVSTNPAYLMNTAASGVAVALQGRVHCSVLGPINKGDLVVTSDVPGVAQRLDPTLWKPGCVIGKSLEIITSNQIATIEVVVGRD